MKRLAFFAPLLVILTGIVLLGRQEGPEDFAPVMNAGEARGDSSPLERPFVLHSDGWDEAFEPEEFGPDELFAKINGGAEVYLEHGFKRLRVYSFLHTQGDYIELFIFDQGTGARFMYEFEQPPTFEEDRRFGGYFSGPSLFMLLDSLYIKVQAAADTPRTRAAVEEIAGLFQQGGDVP